MNKLCFDYFEITATCLHKYESLQMTLSILKIDILLSIFYAANLNE